ncbi:MAG: glycosyltransferase family 2 protein [Elusimicrobia bacterium]|nr:glycosyltransferase family 2 protein [Elusimicrobiota bacterium]
MDLSIVIPVFNEEGNLSQLFGELKSVLDSLGQTSEVIVVDDGSRDRSFSLIQEWSRKDSRFKGVRLSKNYGQTAAISAGLEKSEGKMIAFMDADLQNDPKDLPKLLQKLQEGYDLVSGWRKHRKDPFFSKVLPSHWANWIIARITRVPLHDFGCTLKVYRSGFIKPLRLYGEMHRFVPTFASFLGARMAEVEVNHRKRVSGNSKYGFSRIFKVSLDLVTVKFMEDYMAKPIYVFGGAGAIMGIVGALLATVTLYYKFYVGIYVKDQPLFLVSIFFALIGFQLIFLGIIAEILIRVYYELKDRPSYFVRETVGFN